jgi:hypothetical protein
MKLYLNGILVGENDSAGNLPRFGTEQLNTFGKSHWEDNDDFKGQLDEIRVWEGARTGPQIRASMFQRLRGNEPDLIGLWNFDDNDARELTASGYDGIMVGDALCVEGEIPSSGELPQPMILSGTITDERGHPLANVDIRLTRGGDIHFQTQTDNSGYYRLAIFPKNHSYDLFATWGTKGDWQLSLSLQPGAHRTINLRLKPAVSVSGTLFAWDNTVHQGISVQAVNPSLVGAIHIDESAKRATNPISSEGASIGVVETTLSDEGGKYRFINLKPGQYLVRCYTVCSFRKRA